VLTEANKAANPAGYLQAWLLFGGGLVLLSLGVLAAIRFLPSSRRKRNAAAMKLTSAQKRREGRRLALQVMFPILGSAVLLSIFYAWCPQKILGDWWQLSWVLWMSVFCVPGLLARFRMFGGKKDLRSFVACVLGGTSVGFVAMLLRYADPVRDISTFPQLYALLRVPVSLALYSVFITTYVGFSSGQPGGDDDREWWARLQGWTLLFAAFWMIGIGVGVLGPWFVNWVFDSDPASHTMIKKAVIVISTIASAIGVVGGHSGSSGTQPDQAVTAPQKIKQWILVLSATLAVPAILILLAAGLNALMGRVIETYHSFWGFPIDLAHKGLFAGALWPYKDGVAIALIPSARHALLLSALVFAVSILAVVVAGLLMNFNRFSMHALYRDRLIRAYLGASNVDRNADGFTGFDLHDNMPMHHLRRTHRFVPEDFRSDFDKKTRQPQRTPDDEKRLWKLATLLATGKPGFFDPHLKLLAPREHAEVLELHGLDCPAEPQKWDALEHAVTQYLNKALEQPTLSVGHWGEESAQIKAARLALQNDGCPHLLNRLLIEAQCDSLFAKQEADVPRPMQVVNMALNVVDTPNLAWQQRKAVSFTVTPLHCGFQNGYRSADEYGGPITLGTAMTISGAAASPNMGYHSSPPVTFLMTLFNVRLGCWLGNSAAVPLQWYQEWLQWIGLDLTKKVDPRQEIYRRPDPRHSVLPLINEAIGRTDERYPYIYLSDGGHFDNTGLYEMIRRRCRIIIVSDASCDPKCDFEDLAGAIRKVEIDLKVPIDMRELLFSPDPDKLKENKYCAVGQICYGKVDGEGAVDGVLIYLKPALHQRQPVDLYSHGRSSPDFPHDPTMNQWFSEAMFESYRKLGFETIEHLFGESIPKPTDVRPDEANLSKAVSKITSSYVSTDPLAQLVINAMHEVGIPVTSDKASEQQPPPHDQKTDEPSRTPAPGTAPKAAAEIISQGPQLGVETAVVNKVNRIRVDVFADGSPPTPPPSWPVGAPEPDTHVVVDLDRVLTRVENMLTDQRSKQAIPVESKPIPPTLEEETGSE